MKGFKLNLFLFIICWSVASASIDENEIHPTLELQTIHQETTIKENDLNADKHVVNMTSDTVVHQDFFDTEDLKKICHNQVNEFVWKCPTISDDSEEKILTFRTMNNAMGFSIVAWYLKSINGINIFEMDPETYNHQIHFHVNIYQETISLSRLYPTFPEISGFEILQFIANLGFQCKFSIEVSDSSDVSKVYSALYGKRYYEYHFKGIDWSQNFLFKKIIVKKKPFLDCFETNMRVYIKRLSQLFYENIQVCKNAFVSVESCPISFCTQRLFYEISFPYCLNWSSVGGFPRMNLPPSQRFEITSIDITRMMMKTKKQSNVNFMKINGALIKTYDEIETQIFDTSFLTKLFSNIFELCFVELEKQKSNPNPEDIFKLYLRPCVIPNINLFLKYYTDV